MLKSYFQLTLMTWGILLASMTTVHILGGLDHTRPIAFDSEQDGDVDIYIWNRDTGNVVNMSQTLYEYQVPQWSNDGSLAWVDIRDGNKDVYIWNSHTDTAVNISRQPTDDHTLVWSNDGQLAWMSESDDHADLYVWDSHTD